jgi:hypothetical protein
LAIFNRTVTANANYEARIGSGMAEAGESALCRSSIAHGSIAASIQDGAAIGSAVGFDDNSDGDSVRIVDDGDARSSAILNGHFSRGV